MKGRDERLGGMRGGSHIWDESEDRAVPGGRWNTWDEHRDRILEGLRGHRGQGDTPGMSTG